MEGHGRDSTSGRGEDSLSGASAAAGDPNEAAATAGTPKAGQQGSRDVEMWDEHEEDWKAARRADERYSALKVSRSSPHSRAKWWAWFEPVIVERKGLAVCMLKCTRGEGVCGKPHTPGGWFPPFSQLSTCEVDLGPGKLMEDAKEALVRLAGGEQAREAVIREFGTLRVGGIPADLHDVCSALNERKVQDDGKELVQPASLRRLLWSGHLFQRFPNMAAAVIKLLSAHVTSCASERNWSLFGQIFSKTKNRLTLERARKIAYVRANSSMSSSNAELEEGIMLSVADIEAEDEEGGQ